MNLCKSGGLISARTKSLREKFSRNRSYSELSFKDTNTTSSLVSTPTESCSGSLAERSNSQTGGFSLKKNHAPSATDPFYTADPYGSALDLGAPGFDEPRFPWQRDVAIQCDLLNVPLCPTTTKKTGKDVQTSKKKISSSSTSSAASTLINAAAATLRMTGITDSSPTSSSSSGNTNRFWKSSLLLPSLNVSAVAEGVSGAEEYSEKETCLRRQKSSRWASASAVRRPVLKRAASFDSRGGYARLVQSTSSPSSPPETLVDFEAPRSALPILTTSAGDRQRFNENTSVRNKLSAESSHSASYLSTSPGAASVSDGGGGGGRGGGGGGGNFFFNSHSLTNAFRPTAFLGASAVMAATAPFSTRLSASQSSNSSVRGAITTNPTETSTGTAAAAAAAAANGSNGSSSGRRKLSSNEITLKDIQRKQFLTSRKQPSSAPESFDDDSPFSPKGRSCPNTAGSNSSGENELFNFNTVHRLLNLSLSASNNAENNVVKPFLLELPGGHSVCHPNLPSPNMQSEIQEVNPVLRKLSVLSRAPHRALSARLSDSGPDKKKNNSASAYLDLDDDYFFDDEEEETLSDEPPAAALQRRRRRRALVPPKLITDGYESCNDFDDAKNSKSRNASGRASVNSQIIDGADQQSIVEAMEATDGKSSAASDITDGSSPEPKHLTPNVKIEGAEGDNSSAGKSGQNEREDGVGGALKSPAKANSPKSPKTSRPNASSSGSSGGSSLSGSGHHLGVNQGGRNRRRSSVVVNPVGMQICPGDLLVYSKVLSQRSNMIDNLEGSFSTALLNETEHSRKHKKISSLLRLFDRSTSRNKAAADQILCGLEEVLSQLQPTNSFVDETMLKYRSISWNEFLLQQEERRISNASSFASAASSLVTSASAAAAAAAVGTMGIGCSRFFHGARFSSLQSNALEGANSSPSGGSSTHVCKKISLPAGGITRAMQQNLEKMRLKLDKSKSDLHVVGESLSQGEMAILPEITKPTLRRTESASTVSDVESINENFEVSPIHRKPEEQSKRLSDSTTATEEELGGDRYVESDSFCCSCAVVTKREQRRREALWELFQSDLLFLTEHLMVLKCVFMEPLKKIQVEGYAMFAEPEVLFGNLDELVIVTYAFCREFLNILLSHTSGGELQVTTILVKLFQNSGRAAALTQAYHRYTLNYINALNYLETLRRQIEFTEFEKWCNRDTRCKKLQLTDLLVAPVQHVMRVPLLLKEIETRTNEQSERTSIQAIIQEQEHSLRELDDKMRWLKNFERLLEIQRNIIWPSVLDMDPKVFVPEFLKSLLAKQPCERLIVSPRRQIVLEGPLMVLDSGKPVEMYVFLFDDLLLITRRKKGLGKKQSTLTERFVSNCSGRNSSFSSVVSVGGTSSVSSGAGTGSVTTTNSAASSAVVNAAASVTASAAITALATGGEPTAGPLSGAGGSLFKYVVYKQPLSLDRFYIHDVLPTTDGAANLKNSFVFVCLNRFQQIVTLHTFQAASESAKNIWVSKLRDSSDRWKRTLQSNVFRNPQAATSSHGPKDAGHGPSTSTDKATTSSHLGNRLNINQFQSTRSSLTKNKSPPRHLEVGPSEMKGRTQRLSSGSVSMTSSLRDNASCSYMFDDSILTTSTFT